MTALRVTVRRAEPDDADAIADVHARSWQSAYRGLLPDEVIEQVVAGRQARADRLRAVIAEPDNSTHVWVAARDFEIVGMAVTAPSRDPGASPWTGELEAIYLAPEIIGHGVGRALDERAVADLRQRGFEDATLWVLDSNRRARRFYEAAGWTTDGATKDEERPGGILHEVRYRLTFESTSEVAR